MRKMLVRMGAALLVALLSTGTTVRADTIPWAYIAQSTSINANSGPNPITSPSSTITFTGVSGSSSSQIGSPNPSGVIIYNLTTTSNASDPGDSFTSVHFSLPVTLTDLNSTAIKTGTVKSSDTIALGGTLTVGNVTKTGNISQATIVWDSPSVSAILGSDATGFFKYSASGGQYVVPQSGSNIGSLQLLLSVTPADNPDGSGSGGSSSGGGTSGGSSPSATPEPASLVLAFLGLPLMVVARRRLKNSRPEEIVA